MENRELSIQIEGWFPSYQLSLYITEKRAWNFLPSLHWKKVPFLHALGPRTVKRQNKELATNTTK